MYETFLIDNYLRYQRPRRQEFCLVRGELRNLAHGLNVLEYNETAREGNDGQGENYTARLPARKEGG